MAEQVQDTLEILNSTPAVTIVLTGADASIVAGANSVGGQVEVRESAGNSTVKLDGDEASLTVGANGNGGIISVVNAAGNEFFRVDCNTGVVALGASGSAGSLRLRDGTGADRIELDGGSADIHVKDASGNSWMHFDSTYAALYLGGDGNEGDLVMRDGANKERIKLDAGQGDIWVKNSAGKTLFHFDSQYAAQYLGGEGNEGDLVVRDEANKDRIKLDGGQGDIWVQDAAGNKLFHFDSTYAALWLGGKDNEGDLVVRDHKNKERIKLDGGKGDIWVKSATGHPWFHFDSTYAALWLGGQGNEGDLVVRDEKNKERIKLDGGAGDIWVKNARGNNLFHFDSTYAALWLGGQGNEGDLVVRDAANKERIKLDGGQGDIWVKNAAGVDLFYFDSKFAALYLGGQGNEGDLVVRNSAGDQTIKLDGEGGDIILSNADAAEEFEVADSTQAVEGTVMVLCDDGKLQPCTEACDRKVVGVVAGAGQYRPGIVLDRQAVPNGRRRPISIMGKVACRADASFGSIKMGDLLTTSPTTGCAMRVSDPERARGAVIGKALGTLESGEGLVNMLICLQ